MRLVVTEERWPIAGAFTISRGSKTEARVVVAEISDGENTGRGEATPYAHYGESIESVLAQIETARTAIEGGLDRAGLQTLLPPGAGRNALDCALWDFASKRSGRRAWAMAGLGRLDPVKTAYTVSFGSANAMGEAARAAAGRPLLKLKIGGPDDLDRVVSVRRAAPKARLIVDANEALTLDTLTRLAPDFARLGVKAIEQPLPVGVDQALEGYNSPILLCADESIHSRAELAACARRYGCINIKLDKTGGLTEAVALRAEASALGLEIMAGCMVSTSLSMAPAMLIAQGAAFVDLDGPLLLAKDREPGLEFIGSMIAPYGPEVWG